ncbi:MAG TPA: FHA domain-containing protein [Bryobacteraceae bacterium]|jgi:hypothetical protein|nr:FHA domain-containing protein [Bryobacteraceae bacterium]
MGTESSPVGSPPRLRVRADAPANIDCFFDRSFRIGRVDDCDVTIKNEYVSRNHVEIFFQDGGWWVKDLNSSNGIFVAGQRVELAAVGQSLKIRLGVEGPFVDLNIEQPKPLVARPQRPVPAGGDKKAIDDYAKHYFGQGSPDTPAGERTMYIRQAFAQVQTKQKRKYGGMLAALGVVLIAAAGYAFYEHQQVSKQKALAENIFYAMKSLDVDIANLQRIVLSSSDQAAAAQIQKFNSRRDQMEKNYDQFLSSLKVYNQKLTPQEQLILRVARIFGECELNMPPEFVSEVKNYIQKWQSSGRFARDIKAARENGYTKHITQELLAENLPPQFFYLALQESDFQPFISGPPTRKGIAKGMWQFIPETAVKYGLHLGPLVDFARPDPGDDRHHWDRETIAAGKYLKELYSTDAQASGLLVMACYNWGEVYVLPLVRSMPENPRERNFWKLLSTYRAKIPQETYDYVFYIASAAVIGENPRLFGFDFDNPLTAENGG